MGFGPAKKAVGGTGGKASADAANSFNITFRTDIQAASTKEFAATQQKIASATTKKISKTVVNNVNADKGVLFSSTPGGLLQDKKSFVGKKKRLLFVGAEGIRVGDARLSRTGFSLSEKTLAGTQKLGVTAAAGQVLGTALQSVRKVRDAVRRGDSLSQIGFGFLVAGPGKIANQIGDLFGVNKAGAELAALITGKDANSTKAEIDRFLKIAFDYDNFVKEELHREADRELKEQQQYIATRDADIRKKMKTYPQRTIDQLDFLREDIANDYNEERLFVRDIGGRPLWRSLGVSVNEGQQ